MLIAFFISDFSAGLGLGIIGLLFSYWRYNDRQKNINEYDFNVQQLNSKFGLKWRYEDDNFFEGRLYCQQRVKTDPLLS